MAAHHGGGPVKETVLVIRASGEHRLAGSDRTDPERHAAS